MGSISISGSGGGSSGIVINTTPITGGTSPRVLFDNGATVGEAADFTISSGQPSVAVGSAYLYGTDLVAYGVPAHQSWFYGNAGNLTTTGLGNTGIGDLALSSLTSGPGNTAFGVNALKSLTIGASNLAVGNSAMQNETTGGNCVAIGSGALQTGTGNSSVFAIGDHSCNTMSGGSGIVAIGADTLLNTSLVSETIAIGSSVMSVNNTTGIKNICIGSSTGLRLTTGASNVFIGFSAGSFVTAGANNTIIGHDSGNSITTGSANTIIGNAPGAANSQSCVILAEGTGALAADANFTNANKWTLGTPGGASYITGLVLPWVSTQGVLVADTSGNVTCDSTTAAATVTANFTADHRLQITIGGTTFYIAMSTTPW